MVLLWIEQINSCSGAYSIDGNRNVDIRNFYVPFHKRLTPVFSEEERTTELLQNMDSDALELYYCSLTSKGEITPAHSEYKTVKKALRARNGTLEGSEATIRDFIAFKISQDGLLGSMRRIDQLFTEAQLNVQAKSGLLQAAEIKLPELA